MFFLRRPLQIFLSAVTNVHRWLQTCRSAMAFGKLRRETLPLTQLYLTHVVVINFLLWSIQYLMFIWSENKMLKCSSMCMSGQDVIMKLTQISRFIQIMWNQCLHFIQCVIYQGDFLFSSAKFIMDMIDTLAINRSWDYRNTQWSQSTALNSLTDK